MTDPRSTGRPVSSADPSPTRAASVTLTTGPVRGTFARAALRHPNVELVPVEALWPLREFDRPLRPALHHAIAEDGIQEPLLLSYAPGDRTVLLTEGNNRLAHARALGHTHVPLLAIRRDTAFPDRTREGGRPPQPLPPEMSVPGADGRHVPATLAPTALGFPGLRPDARPSDAAAA